MLTMFTLLWLYTQVAICVAIYCDLNKYVQRDTLCCKPVYNCYPGYEIQPCTEMYGSDRCLSCPRGQVQPEYIDSYSEHRDCFRPKEACTSQNLIPSRGREYCYPQYCKCNTAECYIDEHCVCVKHPGCPINKMLHPVLKTCVDCPKYTFKDHFGCGPCITDILLIYSRHRNTTKETDNEIPGTDKKLQRLNKQSRNKAYRKEKTNITDNEKQKRRLRCNKCKRRKMGGGGRRTLKMIKLKIKRCRRNRKRCLRRKRIIKNFTERMIL